MAVRLLELGRSSLGLGIPQKPPIEERLKSVPVHFLADRAFILQVLLSAYAPSTGNPEEAKALFEKHFLGHDGKNPLNRYFPHVDYMPYFTILDLAIEAADRNFDDLEKIDRYYFLRTDLLNQFGRQVVSDSEPKPVSQDSRFDAFSSFFASGAEPPHITRSINHEWLVGRKMPANLTSRSRLKNLAIIGKLGTPTGGMLVADYAVVAKAAFSSSRENAKRLTGKVRTDVARGVFDYFAGRQWKDVRIGLLNRLSMLEGMRGYPWPPPVPSWFMRHWVMETSLGESIKTFLDASPVSSPDDARSMVTLSFLDDYDRIAAEVQKELKEKQERQKLKATILITSLAVFGAVVGAAGAMTAVVTGIKMATAAVGFKQKVNIAKGLKNMAEGFKESAPQFAGEIQRVFQSFFNSAEDEASEPPETRPSSDSVQDVVETVNEMEDPAPDTELDEESQEINDELKQDAITRRATLISQMAERCKSNSELSSLRGILIKRRVSLGSGTFGRNADTALLSKLSDFLSKDELVKALAAISNLVAGMEVEATRTLIKAEALADKERGNDGNVLSTEAKRNIAEASAMSIALAQLCGNALPGKGIDISLLPLGIQTMVTQLVPEMKEEIKKIGIDAFLVTYVKRAGQAAAVSELLRGSGAESVVNDQVSPVYDAMPTSDIGQGAIEAGRNDILNTSAVSGDLDAVTESLNRANGRFPWIPVAVGGTVFLTGVAIVVSSNQGNR